MGKLGFLLTTLHHHCLYHLLLIAIARLEAYLSVDQDLTRHTQAKKSLILNARSIIGITQHIPIEHSTPLT